MKNNFLNPAVYLCLLLSLTVGCQKQTSAGEAVNTVPTEPIGAKVPANWNHVDDSISAIEDEGAIEEASQPSAELTESINTILDAQQTSLEGLDLSAAPQPPSLGSHPKDWVPWRLAGMVAEIGVSAQGLIGALTAKGSPAVEFVWMKHETFPNPPAEELQNGVSELHLDSQASDEELQFALEPTVQALFKNGRVKDPDRLRGELFRLAKELESTMRLATNIDDGSLWYVDRMRLDVSVTATGYVTLNISSVGIDTRIRMDWTRMQRKSQPPVEEGPVSERAHGIAQVMSLMSRELSTVSETMPLGEMFEATNFRVGLGLSAKGNIGIGKGTGKVVGHVYFKKGKRSSTPPSMIANSGVTMIASAASLKALPPREAPEETVVKVSSAKLRKGLKKAFSIAKFFTSGAEKKTTGKWGLNKIKTNFEMSLSGDVGLVNVTGAAVTQIEFKNKNF